MKRTILLLAILGICKFSFAQESKDEPFVLGLEFSNAMPLKKNNVYPEQQRHDERIIGMLNPTITATGLCRFPIIKDEINLRAGHCVDLASLRNLVSVGSLGVVGIEIKGYTFAFTHGIAREEKYHNINGDIRGNSRNFIRKEVSGIYIETEKDQLIDINILLYSGKNINFYRIKTGYSFGDIRTGFYAERFIGGGAYIEFLMKSTSLFVTTTLINDRDEERGLVFNTIGVGLSTHIF